MEREKVIGRLSKSKLLEFKQCPKKFYFSRLFPQEIEQSEAMIRGSNLHDLFEEFEQYRISNKEFAINKWKHLERFEEKYIPQIKLFMDKFLRKFNGIIPESVEGKIYSEKEDIVIKWDRIDFDGKNRIIWDYKTGKLYKGRAFESKFKFELMIYAFIYMLETKQRINYVGIYFIDHGEYQLLEVTNKDIQDIIVEIKELKMQLNDYYKNNTWPEKYSYLCNYCSFKNKCETYLRFKK